MGTSLFDERFIRDDVEYRSADIDSLKDCMFKIGTIKSAFYIQI